MSVLSNTIHYKECFVTGSHGCVPRHHELAVRLLEKGLVRVRPLITHHFHLLKLTKPLRLWNPERDENYDASSRCFFIGCVSRIILRTIY